MSEPNNTEKERVTEINELAEQQKKTRERKISPESEYGYYYYPERTEKHHWKFWKNFNVFDRYARQHGKCMFNMNVAYESKT